MSKAKFTLIGCYQFFNNAGDNLFSKLTVPETVNVDVLTSNILFRGGEFEVQYANPFTLKDMIELWSKKNAATFDRWVSALAIEYAPLENYDRQESWTDTGHMEGETVSDGTSSASASNEDKISAFDSSAYSPKEKTETSSSTSAEDTVTTETDNTNVRTGRAHGNIGVTTSQQMLESELDLGYWNLYERMTDLFLKEFVIPVYE